MSHKVILELSAPVIIAPYSTFDGILAWCAVQEAISQGTLTDYDACLSTLPLDKTHVGDTYFYNASSWFLDEGADYRYEQAHMHRRFPLEQLATFVPLHKARVDLGAGPDKNYRIPIYPLAVNKLNFLFAGDYDAVEPLLKKWLRAVGRETNVGYGSIKSIQIVEDPADPVLFSDMSVRRPVPQEAVDVINIKAGTERTAVVSYQPPYAPFHPDRKRICVMPDRKKLMGTA